VSPLVRTEDLIDARAVAGILGLSQPNSVSLYQRRYPDMPRPAVDLGPKRPMLWLRPEIEKWAATRANASERRNRGR
jgi:predicted DNA-binding transcriptional regulator AlpA